VSAALIRREKKHELVCSWGNRLRWRRPEGRNPKRLRGAGDACWLSGDRVLGEGPRERARLRVGSPKPRHSQHATVPIISRYLSPWVLLGVTGVVQRPFYHVCSDSFIVSGVAVVGELSVWLLMEPTCFQCARARLAPARARSVSSRSFSHSKYPPDRSLLRPPLVPSALPPMLSDPLPSCPFLTLRLS
jgi:hypothetical protein